MLPQELVARTLHRINPQEYAPLQTISTNEHNLGFTEFKQRVWRRYQHTAFHAEIDRHLEMVAEYLRTNGERGINRLIVEMPPRYGKSESISRHFPAWVLGQLPDTPIILTSYGATLARRNSRSVRNLIKRDEYRQIYPHIELSADKKAAQEWTLARYEGGMIAAGVGGGITGHGGELIIIDDPIKSRAEAESETYRERLKDWYQNDLYTRLEEPGAIILMNTRWHYDDLAGWLLGDNVDGWTRISFPAIAGEDDPLGRAIGEPLWAVRHSAEKLARIAEQMGDYAFSALFQQSPQMGRGTLFDALKLSANVVDEAPNRIVEMVRFYDLAITAKSRSSYTVGLKLGRMADGEMIVLDVWRVQREAPDVHQGVVQNALLDSNKVRIRLEAEKAGLVEWQNLLRDERFHGYIIESDPPQGDKYTRATPIAGRANAGKLKLLKAPWNRAFIEELAIFPNGSTNDQVDALSGAYKMFDQKPVGLVYGEWSIANVDDQLAYNPTQPILWGIMDGDFLPRVILVGQVAADGGLNVLDEYSAVGEGDYEVSIKAGMTLGKVNGWGNSKPAIAYLHDDAKLLKSALWKHGIPTTAAKHSVLEGIQNVRQLVRGKGDTPLLRVHPRCKTLLYEVEVYRNDPDKRTANGEPLPMEVNDRAMNALRFMAWHLRYQ